MNIKRKSAYFSYTANTFCNGKTDYRRFHPGKDTPPAWTDLIHILCMAAFFYRAKRPGPSHLFQQCVRTEKILSNHCLGESVPDGSGVHKCFIQVEFLPCLEMNECHRSVSADIVIGEEIIAAGDRHPATGFCIGPIRIWTTGVNISQKRAGVVLIGLDCHYCFSTGGYHSPRHHRTRCITTNFIRDIYDR